MGRWRAGDMDTTSRCGRTEPENASVATSNNGGTDGYGESDLGAVHHVAF